MSHIQSTMMMHCFDTVLHRLIRYPLPKPEFDTSLKYGIFVTFKKLYGKEYDLRGCIGYLRPITLDQIEDYAINSAFHDPRFDPVTIDEVPLLNCTVSLLYDFEKGKKWNQWTVGTHGIIISFKGDYYNDYYSATFLPEVAEEQGWDVETTILHLIRKSGYRKQVTQELLDSIELTTYKTELGTITFDEYVKMTQERGRDILQYCKEHNIKLK